MRDDARKDTRTSERAEESLETQRESQLRRNQEILKNLGLNLGIIGQYPPTCRPPHRKQRPQRKREAPRQPLLRSRRLQKLDPDEIVEENFTPKPSKQVQNIPKKSLRSVNRSSIQNLKDDILTKLSSKTKNLNSELTEIFVELSSISFIRKEHFEAIAYRRVAKSLSLLSYKLKSGTEARKIAGVGKTSSKS
ncbi:hypothetical protein AAMO2058_000542100 [Amorphochlora amoebiformis]